jgi:hypothetical protein
MSDITRRRRADKPFYSRETYHFLDELNPAGGARRDRTDDLLLAKQALSQLSYGPAQRSKDPGYPAKAGMVGLGRFELPTSRLSSARSNQLSYRPKKHTLAPRNRKGRGQKDAPTTFG